jgi:Secretion system C-terminal sorting domain
MKKLLLFGALFSISTLQAQTYSDNFDSYTAGEYMAEQSAGFWTTWSNTPGTVEDVFVSDADAASAPNSCYFTSTLGTGGPTDLIKSFGLLNTGEFSMNFNMKVPEGKAGYFNFQGTNVNGGLYTLECFFRDSGSIAITNQIGLAFVIPDYTQDAWFNFKMDINFTTNVWEVFLDDVSQGSFSNENNVIAAIDIFPVDQAAPFDAAFYLDDFEYTIGSDTSGTSLTELGSNKSKVAIYPNPADDFANIVLDIEKKSDVAVRVLNIAGQMVSSKNFGFLNGESTINFNTSKLDAGMYMMEISLDNEKITKSLIVN